MLFITPGLAWSRAVMFVADSFPDEVREEKQETPSPNSNAKEMNVTFNRMFPITVHEPSS